jgi:WD40 repeat protein
MKENLHQGNPFPGIRSFESDEDRLFFGRESQIKHVIAKLLNARFLAITGSSGSGKSSFVRAGIIPSLFKDKVVKSDKEWNLSIFRPGSNPIKNLSEALYEAIRKEKETAPEIDSPEKIQSILASDEEGLIKVIETQNRRSPRNRLLIIDQFEELFRYKLNSQNSRAESFEFVKLLLTALKNNTASTYMVITMRSDFLGDCTEYPGLPDAINAGHYLIPRMTDDEKRLAIKGPIEISGAGITEELVERLLEDVGDDPYQLPVMQHALMRTWNYWFINKTENRPIDIRDYEAIGTMSDAISRHAEQIFNDLPTEKSRFITEKLFKALTFLGSEYDVRGTRRPTPFNEILTLTEAKEEEVLDVIDRFRAPGCAFLMPNYQVQIIGETVIDVAHESIMRKWKRLKEWVDEEMKSAERYLRLAKSAELYYEGKAGLLVNPELQLTLRWQQQSKPNRGWAYRYDPAYDKAMEFLDYSKKEYEREIARKENQQKRDLKRARLFAIILGAASLVSILFLVISFNLTLKAEASEQKALEKGQVALLESRKAEQQRNEALAQKKISEQQQQIAEQQQIITEEQKQYAIEQQKIAVEQRQEAILQKQQADEAKGIAIKARDEAEVQRKDAVKQKLIAETERVKAENSERNTMRLRLLDIARSMSIQSVKMQKTMKDDLPSLLALQAYVFNRQNKGSEYSPDIFNALSSLAQDTRTLRGHTDDVRKTAVSPDGGTLASCGDDGAVKLWNLNNADSPFETFRPNSAGQKGFRCVAFSPDGGYLAAGSVDGTVFIWGLRANLSSPLILRGHTSIVNSIAFNKDGQIIVSASSDGTIRLWEIASPNSQGQIIEQSISKINCISFDNTGKFLARGSDDGSIKIYNFFNLIEKPQIIQNGGRPVKCLAYNSFGSLIAAGYSNGLVKIFEISKPAAKPVELIGHSSSVNAVAFSPDGKLLASCSSDKTARLWNYSKNDELPVIIDNHDSWVYSVVFSLNGNKIITSSADKTIKISEIISGTLARIIKNRTTRNLTKDEWNKYVGGDISYEKTLSQLP